MAAVRTHQSATAVSTDGAFTAWLRGVRDELRWPWAFLTVDLTKKPTSPAPNDFDRIRALARSSLPGCRAARKAIRAATLRGLAQATGRDLPEGLVR